MPNSTQKLVVVIPCFNPPEGWEDAFITNFQVIAEQLKNIDLSAIIVNDGSTKEVVKSNEHLTINYKVEGYKTNKGKGYALRYGINNVPDADYYIYTDFDFPYETESFIKVTNLLVHKQADIVAGVKSKQYYNSVPFVRRVISKTLQFMTRVMFRIPNADTQCGLKGFNNIGKPIFLKTEIERFLFDLEFLNLAAKQKDVRTVFQEVELKESITFTKFNYKIIATELYNFIGLFFKSLK